MQALPFTAQIPLGVLWPNFTAAFDGVFGLGFAIEGFSFFLKAIFLVIYVYGWGRLSSRMHLLNDFLWHELIHTCFAT